MSKRSRQQRFRRKKLQQRAANFSPEVARRLQQQVADDIGRGRITAEAIAIEIERSPQEVAAALGYALARVQVAVLENYRSLLRSKSIGLRGNGAWLFLAEKRAEARKYGIESELEHLVLKAAGDFADSRMVRTRRVVGVQRL